MNDKVMPKIALGTWSWGVGMIGGDQVFGNRLGKEELEPVFEAAMNNGLNLWDTAVAYGMVHSHRNMQERMLLSPQSSHPRLQEQKLIQWKQCVMEV